MSERYEYNGKIYCEEDLSEEIENYNGDLYDLYSELRKDRLVSEETLYYSDAFPENPYEDLIKDVFSDLEVTDHGTEKENEA